jgi:hypothetical protein
VRIREMSETNGIGRSRGVYGGIKRMGKEMRMREWKRKYQEDGKEGTMKKKIFITKGVIIFCCLYSAQNKMLVGWTMDCVQ